MTIDETRKILSFLFSAFPSAPRLSREDKDRMIISFFKVLCEYSFNDVLRACIECAKGGRGFIPSVFEIAKNVNISPEIAPVDLSERERYLLTKFDGVDVYDLRQKKRLEFDLIGSCTAAGEIAEINEYIDLKKDIDRRVKSAEVEAIKRYRAFNLERAKPDIIKYLGVEHEKATTAIE